VSLLQRAGAKRYLELLQELGMNPGVGVELFEGVVPVIQLPLTQPIGGSDAGIAGTSNLATTQLFNPANSSVNLHLISAVAQSSDDDSIFFGFLDTVLTSTHVAVWLNRLFSGGPQAVSASQDIAATGAIHEAFDALALVAIASKIAPHVVLKPGQGFFARLATTVFAINTNFVWREVPIIRT